MLATRAASVRQKGRAAMCFGLVRRIMLAILMVAGCSGAAIAQTTASLPSWNEGATKKSITDFVSRVARPGGADFVAAE